MQQLNPGRAPARLDTPPMSNVGGLLSKVLTIVFGSGVRIFNLGKLTFSKRRPEAVLKSDFQVV